MIDDDEYEVPLTISLALEVDIWPITSVMELVRALSRTAPPSWTASQEQNREVSKWSYTYVKELLLSAPRAPTTISPSHVDTHASTELSTLSTRPQNPLIRQLTPEGCNGFAAASATNPRNEEEPGIVTSIGTKTELPAAPQEAELISAGANATESATATGKAIPFDLTGNLPSEAAPVLRLSRNLYISPNMRTGHRYQELWTEQIKDRLNAELWHALRTERCIQEFVMAGSRPDSLKASILITCCGEAAAKRVRKVVKRLKWLREFDVPCAVVVDTIHLYAEQPSETRDTTPAIEAQLPSKPRTMCGRRIRKSSPQDGRGPFCTLGGLILVEGLPFGLTVAHAFQTEFETSGVQSSDESDVESGAGSSYGDEGFSASPFVSFDDENDGDTSDDWSQSLDEPSQVPCVAPGDPGHDDLAEHPNQKEVEGMAYRRIGQALPPIRREGPAMQRSSDWALIDIDDPSCFLLNESKGLGQNASTMIEEMASDHMQADGHVDVVLAREEVCSGWLMSSPVLFKAGNLVMDTRLIIMDRKLAYGDSGAWVVQDGMLCGHVVGGRGHLPWAYMVPIHQVIREVKVAFDTDDVCLPKSASEFPPRMLPQEPSPGVTIGPHNEDKSTMISHSVLPSAGLTGELIKEFANPGALLSETNLQSPKYAGLNQPTSPYGAILGKIKGRMTLVSTGGRTDPPADALDSLTVDTISAVARLLEIPSGSQGSEERAPITRNELQPSAFRNRATSTRSMASQNARPAEVEPNVILISRRSRESWVSCDDGSNLVFPVAEISQARQEAGSPASNARKKLDTRPEAHREYSTPRPEAYMEYTNPRPGAYMGYTNLSQHTSSPIIPIDYPHELPTAKTETHAFPRLQTLEFPVHPRVGPPKRTLILRGLLVAVVLIVGLGLGLGLGFTKTNAARSVPTGSKVGIGIGAGIGAVFLWVWILFLTWKHPMFWTRLRKRITRPTLPTVVAALLTSALVVGLSVGLTYSSLRLSVKILIGVIFGVISEFIIVSGSWVWQRNRRGRIAAMMAPSLAPGLSQPWNPYSNKKGEAVQGQYQGAELEGSQARHELPSG